MPSSLDFGSTSKFRNYLLGKTLKVPNGPLTFTAQDYQTQTLSEYSDKNLGGVGLVSGSSLNQTSTQNLFKPENWFIKDNLEILPRRANLSLYPYFVSGDYTLYSIVNSSKFDTESELFKFAANLIKTDTNGPVYSRISQNIQKNTLGKNRLLDALNGNTNTAVNIITGKEPLVESNYSITVDNSISLPGLATNFLSLTTGVEFPFSIIPGDILTNPYAPDPNPRPIPKSQLGKLWQDATGALGSMIGIQRRPTNTRNPSDILVDYMGQGQRNRLFDLLSFSKYAPNYTTTARSQNTSKLFTFADKIAQGGKSLLGIEAPTGKAYIGDDRGNSVSHAMNDFYDRPVRSSYYLSLMFDEQAAKLFHTPSKNKTIGDGGAIAGGLTWVSSNSKNKPGVNNNNFSDQAAQFQDSLSLKYGFRQDSILGNTQEILNSLPSNGGESRSHVANVIDQTSRLFKDGDVKISRGNAVQYVSKFNKSETGVEYGRVWTKDRAYATLADTMPLNDIEPQSRYYSGSTIPFRRTNIRRFNGSVLDNTWNINIAPMSNGKKSFDGSTNIVEHTKGQGDFYAKKYMFSIENLAWKSSSKSGYTVNDLPYCERGNNGGRVMWFPPYDLKVSETNSAQWEDNKFIGRPEPVYTYSYTQRNATISFKVVVDHPSILNLLVREHFKNMSDEESDNYINAFFAGIKDIDFYSLIQTYTTLDQNDRDLIQAYLNGGVTKQTITSLKYTAQPGTTINKSTPSAPLGNPFSAYFYYDNDLPSGTDYNTEQKFEDLFVNQNQTQTISLSRTALTTLTGDTSNQNDKNLAFGKGTTNVDGTMIDTNISQLQTELNKFTQSFIDYKNYISVLQTDIENNNVKDIQFTVKTSSSAPASVKYNYKLSIRRAISIVKDFVSKLVKNGDVSKLPDFSSEKYTKIFEAAFTKDSGYKLDYNKGQAIILNLKDLGFDKSDGTLNIDFTSVGEQNIEMGYSCNEQVYSTNDLLINAPKSIYCRQGFVKLVVIRKDTSKDIEQITTYGPITATLDSKEVTVGNVPKPNIDVMKRIVMKTLSECFYFKKLEESSPVVFKSLKEKLRYFHPGFHSMTPEGLNSRLTFLLQCIRPGDTIPIKGINESTDLNARNTTFGPPPICVLRIGDFYHTKMVVKDVNIDYNDSPWDMNPEGIGMQPMIANVTMQVSLIGGQGLEKPVDTLQNALSSNFFGNTEMYDERSIATNTLIGGKNANDFTKQFLEQLQNQPQNKLAALNKTPPKPTQGVTIGNKITISGVTSLDYTDLINDVFTNVENYNGIFPDAFLNIYTNYGPIISGLFLDSKYRTINKYNVYTNNSNYSQTNLFGEYDTTTFDVTNAINGLKAAVENGLNQYTPSSILGFNLILGNSSSIADDILKPQMIEIAKSKIDALSQILNSLNPLIKSRNKLIETLDKLNFILKYDYPSLSEAQDVSIDKGVYTQYVLTGFSQTDFSAEYLAPLQNLQINYNFFYNLLDTTSIDFNNPTVNSTSLKSILGVLFNNVSVNDFFSGFTNNKIILQDTVDVLKNMFKVFQSVYGKIEKPIYKPLKQIKRTSTKQIAYGYGATGTVTDSNVIGEINKVFSPTNTIGTTLNLYNHG